MRKYPGLHPRRKKLGRSRDYFQVELSSFDGLEAAVMYQRHPHKNINVKFQLDHLVVVLNLPHEYHQVLNLRWGHKVVRFKNIIYFLKVIFKRTKKFNFTFFDSVVFRNIYKSHIIHCKFTLSHKNWHKEKMLQDRNKMYSTYPVLLLLPIWKHWEK